MGRFLEILGIPKQKIFSGKVESGHNVSAAGKRRLLRTLPRQCRGPPGIKTRAMKLATCQWRPISGVNFDVVSRRLVVSRRRGISNGRIVAEVVRDDVRNIGRSGIAGPSGPTDLASIWRPGVLGKESRGDIKIP